MVNNIGNYGDIDKIFHRNVAAFFSEAPGARPKQPNNTILKKYGDLLCEKRASAIRT